MGTATWPSAGDDVRCAVAVNVAGGHSDATAERGIISQEAEANGSVRIVNKDVGSSARIRADGKKIGNDRPDACGCCSADGIRRRHIAGWYNAHHTNSNVVTTGLRIRVRTNDIKLAGTGAILNGSYRCRAVAPVDCC